MSITRSVSAAGDGVTLKAYRGDRGVLLAMDLAANLTTNLAGFAIQWTPPGGQAAYLPNRLSFGQAMTAGSAPESRTWTPSNQAPFQKFSWIDYPSHVTAGAYTYAATAMFWQPDGSLQPGPSASLQIELIPTGRDFQHFDLGFTRGYLSSQAYAAEFGNAPVRPEPKSIAYDTAPFQNAYRWLGAHARELVFDFLAEALADSTVTLDVFAYDLDEPDVIRSLAQFGSRLRLVFDNAQLHTKPGALENDARGVLLASAGADHVRLGHFKRFAHDKVLIQKRNGVPVKVLTGSANFSVRGLYVQANNVLCFDDPAVAALYEQAFQEAFQDMPHFDRAPIAGQWFDVPANGIPAASVSFSPHKTAAVSLDRVAAAIQQAHSSVLFAVMELGGGGSVLQALRTLPARSNIFSYGVTQSAGGDLTIYKPGQQGIIVPFSFLENKVPANFRAEYRGGPGQVIHHKFVVVDFNDTQPVVFAGSSNLADGGEQDNGDNLLAIGDPDVVQAYAVEAIRLVDHYHFRAAWQRATSTAPLTLSQDRSNPWYKPYYDPSNMKYRQRTLFAQ